MKSPFPGMDPYLESRWLDIHSRLAFLASLQLKPQLPKDLKARIEEEFVIESENPSRHRRISPDTSVTELRKTSQTSGVSASDVAVMTPLVVTWEAEPTIQRSVRILDSKRGNRLVTSIEFLSPSN